MIDAPIKPHPTSYVRDGVPGLTLQQQIDAIALAHHPIEHAYIDRLSKAQAKRRDPADLKQRAVMLRSPTRHPPELVIVASLRCLGWTMADIASALAAAGRRNASVLALDRGETYNHRSLEPKLLEALADAETGRKRAQTAAGRSAGVAAAKSRHEKRRQEWLTKALLQWERPSEEITAKEIAAEFKVSVRTLNQWLGPREQARTAAAKRKVKNDE
jgi:hypothetical protein